MSFLYIILLSVASEVVLASLRNVTIQCWPLMLEENISNGHIHLATADMACRIKEHYRLEDELEVTKMTGLYRQYENLLLALNFDFRFPELPRLMPKGIGRVVAKSHGHRLKKFKIDSQRNLKEIQRVTFANMPELEQLNITKNLELSKLPTDVFFDLTSLLALDLSGNRLEKLHVLLLKNLILLEKFSAADNKIQTIDEQLFRFNKNLKFVDLRSTSLLRINVDFTKYPSLEVIKIGNSTQSRS